MKNNLSFKTRFKSGLKYFNRILNIVILVILIEFVQLPVIFLAKAHHPIQQGLLILIYFASYALLIGAAWHFYKKYHPKPLGKLTGNDIVVAIGVYVLYYFFSTAMVGLSTVIFHQSQSSNNVAIQSLLSSNSLVLCVMMVGIIFLSPILEELVFRGMIVDGLFPNAKLIWPMLVSGAAFASAHAFSNPFLFLVYGGMGAGMVFIYRKTGTLKANIFFHMLNNTLASISIIIVLIK
ncbi:CPBP family intramembrane glutamic endopeptidase [Lactobacillus sp. Sy-1]|uniref:CPBP family intramembrane glutamic endopeptidase n=1 Tax=Lactobacillus sp. Sy-1 TaxID=2109645 RepID=UPI001C57A26B|nr:type II CAAX endopeptidase family protein [Lactobacillus sp. Sy-1]MBW1605095.1 CPBP family intramembrane metalloprotease [Lactobacillus sp. Sy-1]